MARMIADSGSTWLKSRDDEVWCWNPWVCNLHSSRSVWGSSGQRSRPLVRNNMTSSILWSPSFLFVKAFFRSAMSTKVDYSPHWLSSRDSRRELINSSSCPLTEFNSIVQRNSVHRQDIRFQKRGHYGRSDLCTKREVDSINFRLPSHQQEAKVKPPGWAMFKHISMFLFYPYNPVWSETDFEHFRSRWVSFQWWMGITMRRQDWQIKWDLLKALFLERLWGWWLDGYDIGCRPWDLLAFCLLNWPGDKYGASSLETRRIGRNAKGNVFDQEKEEFLVSGQLNGYF